MALSDKLKKLAKEHAEKYDPNVVSPEDATAPRKPLYVQDLEERAAGQGKTAAEVWSEDRVTLANSHFPSAECLKPGELLLAVSRHPNLGESRWVHLHSCSYCQVLTANSELDKAFVDEMGRLLAQSPEEPAAMWAWLRTRAFVFTAEMVAPIILFTSAVAFVLFAHLLVPRDTTMALSSRMNAGRALLPGAIALTAFFLLAAVALRAWNVLPGLQRSGAIYAGIILGVEAGGYTWWDLGQRARQTEAAVTLVSSSVARVAAASLNAHDTDGKFPKIESSPGALELTTVRHTAQGGQYSARAEGLKGEVVAHVWPEGGAVYWARGDKFYEIGRLVRGTIQSAGSDGIVFSTPDGAKTTTLKRQWDPLLKPGQKVMAVVDPHTNAALAVYPLTQ